MDTPAGSSSGQSPTPTEELSEGTVELPAKLRVHALAKQLGASSREVITTLESLGESVRSAQSNITREVALRVVQSLRPEQLVDQPDTAESDEKAAEESVPAPSGAPETGFSAPPADEPAQQVSAPGLSPLFEAPQAMFLAPSAPAEPKKQAEPKKPAERQPAERQPEAEDDTDTGRDDETDDEDGDDEDGEQGGRRRRRRGRRGRGRGRGGDETTDSNEDSSDELRDKPGKRGGKQAEAKSDKKADQKAEPDRSEGSGPKDDKSDDDGDASNRRRRRRRRRKGTGDDDGPTREDDPPNTVVHVRESAPEKDSSSDDEVRAIKGSTRLEAKRQRRRDGREAGRRRAPVLSESEFLARRESVERRMVVREHGDQTQIAVLEDNVLVENFVTSSGSGSLVGNVYLGRVQNVLPSMEAAFVDIGRGRNAVLYAGEVDWDAAGLAGKARRIEQALSTGDSVLVQVTKDPIGHKGARLTTQISLPGRFLVYVPGGGATGISRKLPDNERKRLKEILKRVVPENAGVIIRTASEGTSEESLDRDVTRLQAQWEVIKEKADQPKAQAPQLLYEEPDLLIKVVRDLFTEDFSALTVQGDDAWDTIEAYVSHVAPDLASRLHKHTGKSDVFTEQRVNEQISKALDRKVWLPSGGYLIIDRTEAMTVIDVNTGKFTGSGGNLEETVTRNNLESAEEIVRQLRLRDIGGIIVIDFIDMVLESNRDLVLRRLTECLGRDRTRHQVAEVTSLGLVQMTRKRVGTGLLEAYSSTCEHCRGRGVLVTTDMPSQGHKHDGPKQDQSGGSRRKRGKGQQDGDSQEPAASTKQDTPKESKAGEKTPEPKAAEKAAEPKAPEPEQARTDKRSDKHGRDKSEESTQPKPVLEPRGMTEPSPQRTQAGKPAADEGDGTKTPASRSRRRKVSRPAGSAGGAAAPVVASEPAEPVVSTPEPVPSTPEPVVSTPEPNGTPDQAAAEDSAVGDGAGTAARRTRRKVSRPAGSGGGTAAPLVVEAGATETNGEPVAAQPEPVTSVPEAAPVRRPRRRAASRPAGPAAAESSDEG